MKKLLILTLFALGFIEGSAQNPTWQKIFGNQRFETALGIPVMDTITRGSNDTSNIRIRPQDGILYYRRNGAWIRASAQDVSDFVTKSTVQTITGEKTFVTPLNVLAGGSGGAKATFNSLANGGNKWHIGAWSNVNDLPRSFGFYNELSGKTPLVIDTQRLQFINPFEITWTIDDVGFADSGYPNAGLAWDSANRLQVNTGVKNTYADLKLRNGIFNGLTGSGTRMATVSASGILGATDLPYTKGYIDSNFLPLTAGSGKPLTGTLYGTGANMTNNIVANTFIKATGTANQIMLADGTTLDKTNLYTGDATFDTTGRVLTLPKVGGGSTSVVIPRGTSSGAEGITALSSSRSGNLLTIAGDNGSSTVISIRDADSASLVRFTDTASIVLGYTRLQRFIDSLAAVQARIQTKQPLGNYLTRADSLSGGYTSWDLTKKKVDSLGTIIATKGTGTVTSVAASAGTGISVSGSPIIGSGTLTITNTAPDQTVTLTAGTGISVSGTYPNFTVTNSSPSSGGTVTSITASAPLTGGTITSSGTIGITQASTSTNGFLSSTDWNTFNNKVSYTDALARGALSAGTGISYNSTTGVITNSAPDQTVSLTAGTNISVTGTYPNFTINNTSTANGTVTSVGLSAPTGFSVSGSPVTSSGTLTLGFAAGYSLPTDANQTNWTTAFNKRLSSASLSSSQLTLTLADASTVTTSVPTFNQNTTGTAGSLSAVLSSTLGGAGSVSGILKANGSGVVSPAVAGTDYVVPSALSSYLPLSGGTMSGSIFGGGNGFRVSDGMGLWSATNLQNGLYWNATDGKFQMRIANDDGAMQWSTTTVSTTKALSGTSASFSGGVNMATSSGNVSIGTASPIYKLDVVGGDNDGVVYRTSTRSIGIGQVSSQASVFWGSGTALTFFSGAEIARFSSSGRLLIGTPTDNGTDALQVNGSGLFGGKITATSANTEGLQFGTVSRIRQQTANTRIEFITADAADFYDIAAKAATFSSSVTASGYRFAYSAKSSNYTLTDNDDYIIVSNASTITLPTAVGRSGKRYVIRSTAGAGVTSTLATTSSQTVDGAAGTFAFGNGNYNILIVFSDGANWYSEQWVTGS